MQTEQKHRDLAGTLPKFVQTWGTPIAAMIAAVLLDPIPKTTVWITAKSGPATSPLLFVGTTSD